MNDLPGLKDIFMNNEGLDHLKQAGEWLEYGAIAVAVPVVITTTHATAMNYWKAS